MKLKLNPKPLVLVVAVLAPIGAIANIQQQIHAMYDGLINTTAPGAYQTATRGVVTGGAVTLRNRISTANLVSITPPSAKGGCGGINLYTGSFSYINGEEFIALMRNVASNATGVVSGFAFELAMEAMDSATNGVLRNLTNTIKSFNQMFSNSCQLAQGVVSGAQEAFSEKRDLKSALRVMAENVAPDYFASKSPKEESSAKRLAASGKAKACADTGNILWCAMRVIDLDNQALYGSEDNSEFVLSMVGSLNVVLTEDDKGGETFMPQPIPRLINKDALRIFVEGNDDTATRVYDCASDDLDQCLEPNTRLLGTFKGLAARIVDDLQQNQVFERFAKGNASPADGERLQWLARSRIGVNLMTIVQKNGAQAGYDYLGNYSKLLAADATASFILEMLDVTEKGLSSMTMADSVKVLENLRDSHNRVMAEYRDLLLSYGGYKDADRQALDLLETAPNSDPSKLPQGTTSSHAG